jgi:hypothetical protein
MAPSIVEIITILDVGLEQVAEVWITEKPAHARRRLHYQKYTKRCK